MDTVGILLRAGAEGRDVGSIADQFDRVEVPARPGAEYPLDLEAMHIPPGGILTIESRRGRISLYARADDGTPRGTVFVPFCFYEAAANMLTNPVLDPFGKIPEFKYCAVRVTEGGPLPARMSFGGGAILATQNPRSDREI